MPPLSGPVCFSCLISRLMPEQTDDKALYLIHMPRALGLSPRTTKQEQRFRWLLEYKYPTNLQALGISQKQRKRQRVSDIRHWDSENFCLGARGGRSVVWHLSNMLEALDSTPTTSKEKEKKIIYQGQLLIGSQLENICGRQRGFLLQQMRTRYRNPQPDQKERKCMWALNTQSSHTLPHPFWEDSPAWSRPASSEVEARELVQGQTLFATWDLICQALRPYLHKQTNNCVGKRSLLKSECIIRLASES